MPTAPFHIHNTRNAMNSRKYFTSRKTIITSSIPTCGCLLLFVCLLLQGPPANALGFYSTVSCTLAFYFIMACSWNYPTLASNELEIRNALYGFYKKSYIYDDIKCVEVCGWSIYHWPCVKIYPTKRKRPYSHCLDCMSQDSIPAFLNELNSHGVKAICTVDYK